MWKSYRKRKALRSYRSVLGQRLRGRFGTRRHYTPAEVGETARLYGLNELYLCYALAMYCERTAFDLHHAERGEACDYDAMRAEVGERLFAGDTSFDGSTLTDTSHPHAHADVDVGGSSDCGGGGFDAGGFDGGGCGGGD